MRSKIKLGNPSLVRKSFRLLTPIDRRHLFFITVVQAGLSVMDIGVSDAVALLIDNGFIPVVVTNQPDIARGFVTLETVLDINHASQT
jgi:hypothetical protein